MLSKFHSPSHRPGSLEATSSDSLVSEWLLRFSDVHANATQFLKALFIYFLFNTLVQMRSSTRFETSKWNGGEKGYHPAKKKLPSSESYHLLGKLSLSSLLYFDAILLHLQT